MKLENAGELVTVGQKIVTLGMKLDEARAVLTKAQAEVAAIESELRPLLVRHSELIQSAVGSGIVLSAPPPAVPVMAASNPVSAATPLSELSLAAPGSPQALPASQQMKERVKNFLKTKNVDGISASDVAEALHIDALLVREAMLEMKHGR